MPGNDDGEFVGEILSEGQNLINPEGRTIELGPYQMLSYGWAKITPWKSPRELPEDQLEARIEALVADPRLTVSELAERAGVPEGVLSVVTGNSRAIGGEMTANPLVRKLTFTGSTEVGKVLMRQCASTVKKMSMELGGNAPFIVFDDADLDAAAEGAVASKFRNGGQTCVCANRILVQDRVYDAFAARLADKVRGLEVGNGMEPGVTQGPLIDMNAVRKVESHIADAVAKGARLVAGGKRHSLGGTFFEPTILGDVTSGMQVAREETFGPLAPLFRFTTEKEAIRMANDTEFGLACYFYSRDIGRIWRSRRRSNTVSWALTRGSFPTRSPRLAE